MNHYFLKMPLKHKGTLPVEGVRILEEGNGGGGTRRKRLRTTEQGCILFTYIVFPLNSLLYSQCG
jgi:hypothetical protein